MNRYLKHTLGAILNGDTETANAYLRLNVQNLIASKLNEDHEMYMTLEQMEKHLGRLHEMADDKPAFLSTLANYTDKDTCTEKDFRECAENIGSKGKDFTDKAIHKLEKQIGYNFNPKDLRESFMDIIKRNSLPTPPNFMEKKDVKKLKKTPPKLKKSVYGTGNPPALGMGGGPQGGGDVGGGDGGAGGGDGGAGGGAGGA